jgi:hypothetical protein
MRWKLLDVTLIRQDLLSAKADYAKQLTGKVLKCFKILIFL